jgi:hypothetical protein
MDERTDVCTNVTKDAGIEVRCNTCEQLLHTYPFNAAHDQSELRRLIDTVADAHKPQCTGKAGTRH